MLQLFRSFQRGLLLTAALLVPLCAQAQDRSMDALAERVEAIDEKMPGRIGVYIKRLADGQEIRHRMDRDWYLASTIKIPLAIAVLQQVEAGELTLDQELVLAESDFVDGSGELLYAEPGSRYTVQDLIRRSTEQSDSTATDMLIRLLGEEDFNRHLQTRIAEQGFNPITPIVQVRADAYSQVHPQAQQLTNLDFIELRGSQALDARYQALLRMLAVDPGDAQVDDLWQAFDRYYENGLNSGSLVAMGDVLERLLAGDYLNAEHTELLLEIMRGVSTGDRRIKAGLPQGTDFAHKTGTQIDRSCNVGIINSATPEQAIVVAACAEGYRELGAAEQAFRQLGRALSDTLL